jgi:hypothetical protein
MAKTLGGIFLAAFVVMFIVNGVYMLIFPRAWLRLPEWVPTAGTAFRERYGTDWDTDDRCDFPRWHCLGRLRLFLPLMLADKGA